MSYDFTKSTRPKARKEYGCEQCHKKIIVGEVYSKTSGKFDGDMFTYHAHVECVEAAREINNLQGNSWDEGVYLAGGNLDREEEELLLKKHPIVAARLGINLKAD